MFSWGRFGKLGHGSLEDIMAPTLVQSIYHHHVTKVATGPRHSVALTGTCLLPYLRRSVFDRALAGSRLVCLCVAV